MADVTLARSKISLIEQPGGPGHAPASVPPPQPVQARTSASLSETRGIAGFAMRTPSYTAGFQFLHAAVLSSPRRGAVMSFTGPGNRRGFEVFQAPLSQYQQDAAGKALYYVVGESLSATTVGGSAAALASSPPAQGRPAAVTSLVWEAGDLLCHVTGMGLSQQELTRIATSMAS
jgi:hypothetical protein